MATQILAVGTTAASSADVVIASGGTLTVSLKDSDGGYVKGRVRIELKDDGGKYVVVGELSGTVGRSSVVIDAAGTYRFTRYPGDSCGVFSA